LHARVFGFFTKYNILSDKQFGFMSERSTFDAVANFIDSVYDVLNKGH